MIICCKINTDEKDICVQLESKWVNRFELIGHHIITYEVIDSEYQQTTLDKYTLLDTPTCWVLLVGKNAYLNANLDTLLEQMSDGKYENLFKILVKSMHLKNQKRTVHYIQNIEVKKKEE